MTKNYSDDLIEKVLKIENENLIVLGNSFLAREILIATSHLPSNFSTKQRIWHIINNTDDVPKCKMCDTPVKWDANLAAGQKQKYRTYCSHKCLHSDPDQQAKKRKTEIERYGIGKPGIVEKQKITEYLHYSKLDENYKNVLMSLFDIKQVLISYFNILFENGHINKKAKLLLSYCPNITNCILNVTSFLPTDAGMIERLYCIKQEITNPVLCENCKTPLLFCKDITGYNKFCGLFCANQSPETKDKKKNTWVEHLGVDNPSKSPLIEQTKQETSIQHFGVKYPNQKHIDPTILSNLNNKQWLYNEHVILKKPLITIAAELNVSDNMIGTYMRKHNITTQRFDTSQHESKLLQFLTDQNIKIIQNDRTIIAPKELDFYIASHNLAIELNGVYWHSELQGRDRNYHVSKYDECAKNNIRLLQFWDSEWILKQDIVKSKILTLLGISEKIYARKCKLVNVISGTKNKFLNENHLQGSCASQINIGLLYNNELVSVMCFSKSRFSKNYQYEMTRFCNKQNTVIVGGASKLFKHFVEMFDPTSVVSYCDLRYGSGEFYNHLAFKYLHYSKPNYYYFVPGSIELFHRIKFQKHKLKDQLKIFDDNITEWENMQNNGYDRIWDCGNDVYVWNKN